MDNSDYHVIIIAAGSSRRLSKLTKNKPKAFLEIRGKKIIEHTLDFLNERGFRRVTFVIGYLKDIFKETIGEKYKNLSIDYVISEDYASTGHGWSTFLSKNAWEKEKKDVIFIHGDILYDSGLLDKVLASKYKNIMIVDNDYEILTGDERIVMGKNGITKGFKDAASKDDPESIGELIGINKWSKDLMEQMYFYMQEYFNRNGKNHNYEPVLSDFIRDTGVVINYMKSNGLPWVNINYEEDYEKAKNEIYN